MSDFQARLTCWAFGVLALLSYAKRSGILKASGLCSCSGLLQDVSNLRTAPFLSGDKTSKSGIGESGRRGGSGESKRDFGGSVALTPGSLVAVVREGNFG